MVTAPLTGSALIKALKGASDPPVAGGPTKIALAAAAWADEGLVVPRKADVIRDWVLEAWARPKTGQSAIANADYHQLLVDVSKACAAPALAPLSLLGTYISSAVDDNELGRAAAESLPLLFGEGVKSDAWADMLGRLVTALETGPWNSLAPAARLICSGLATSLPTSPNAKKIAQSLHAKLPAVAGALHAHPQFSEVISPILPALFFPLGVLQTVEPLKQLLSHLLPPSPSPTSESLSPALGFVPVALSAFIDATKQHQYTLYGKADKDKPLEVYIADRTRAAVIPALGAALDLLNRLEDGALARPSSSTAAPALGFALWSSRLALWERVLQWGGYLETDSKAAALVTAEARRGSTALAMYGATEGQGAEEGLAGRVLRTLDALERLDHARSALGTDVVGWCLAAPERCHLPARTLLASILRYHVLTHSLEQYFVLLADAIRGLFDPSLPSEALDPLYTLVATGPLTERAFRADLSAAVRGVNLGGRRGAVWASILRLLAARAREGLEGAETGGKRKRGVSPCGARLAAVLSRLVKVMLDASARARAGDDEEVVQEAVAAFGDEWPAVAEGKKKRKSMGGDDAAELLFAARLRVARAAGLLHRDEEFITRTQLASVAATFTLPELRLEAFHFLYTALALRQEAAVDSGVIDALLPTLTASSKKAWSGRDANVSEKTLAAAAWTLAAEGGLSVFETALPAQLDTLASTIVARTGPVEEDEGLSVRRALARVLGTAETWELSSLRAALLRALVTAAKEGGGFAVLAASPAPWLSKSARGALIAAAYEADANAEPGTRDAIRAWLARLAEGDVLGPLTQASTLKHLLKTAAGAEDATLELVALGFTSVVKTAARDPAPLTAAIGVLKKPYKAMDVRSRAAAAFFDAANPSGWEGELRAAAESLASEARKNLPASTLGADPARLRAHLSLARFEARLGRAVESGNLLPAVLASRDPAAATPALEAIALASDTDTTLAAYLTLRSFGGTALDAAFAGIAASLTAEAYAAAFAALLPLLPRAGALRATRILISAPVSGSGRALAAVLPALLSALEGAAATHDAAVLEETLRVHHPPPRCGADGRA
ncbi:unnamed protein product [Cutaneotrichosporon oleaginosum]